MATHNETAAPDSWSVAQCVEHLCRMKEVYLPPISAALKEKPGSPVERISPGKQA
jgi:hypothetical protein